MQDVSATHLRRPFTLVNSMSTRTEAPASPGSGERTPHSSHRSSGSLLPLLLLFGAAKLLLQIVLTILSVHAGYGIFRDELYYLVCGHRLAFGYVDQPPLVALQARAAELLFGSGNLLLFRLLPNLAGALMVMLTGLLAQALGGGRRAAAYAMLAVLTIPVFIATQSFISMNAWEPVFWMGAVWALLRLLAGERGPRWWWLLGISAGLGLENKASTVFFLAALVLGLAATPARRLLFTRGFALAAAVTMLLALPNFLWQVHNHFPTYEWLHDVKHSTKLTVLPAHQFLLAQVLMLSPLELLVWVPGCLWLLTSRAARPFRAAGWLYLLFLAIMFALHAKDYYLAPVYPLLFASGGVAMAQWSRFHRRRRVAAGVYLALLAASVAFTAPFAVPILPPKQYIAYTQWTHIAPTESEQHPGSAFPEFFADHLDWQRLAIAVARVYHSLPPAEQQQTGIVAANYGQASALTILGKPLGLPPAISGHQNYWLWGPGSYTGKEMIVVTDAPVRELLRLYRSCTEAERQTSPYQMPWEQRSIFLCRDRIKPYSEDWNALKFYR